MNMIELTSAAPDVFQPANAHMADIAALAKDAIVSRFLEPDETVTLRVLQGVAWITMEGCTEDYVLHANQRVQFSGPGKVVAQALGGEAVVASLSSAPAH